MLWEDCPLSNGPIPLRTFHEQRKGIKEMFGVEIVGRGAGAGGVERKDEGED